MTNFTFVSNDTVFWNMTKANLDATLGAKTSYEQFLTWCANPPKVYQWCAEQHFSFHMFDIVFLVLTVCATFAFDLIVDWLPDHWKISQFILRHYGKLNSAVHIIRVVCTAAIAWRLVF